MESTVLQLRVEIDRFEDTVFIVVHGQLGTEKSTMRVPLTAGEARALSSLLVGAAAAADPVGHEAILDQVGQLFDQKILDLMPVKGTH